MSDLPDDLFRDPDVPRRSRAADPGQPLPPIVPVESATPPVVVAPAPAPAAPPAAAPAPEPERRGASRAAAGVAIALVLALGVVGTGLWLVLRTPGYVAMSPAPVPSTVAAASAGASGSRGASAGAASSTAASATPSRTPSAAATPWVGAVAALAPVGASATCQAGAGTDDAGNPVTYEPARLLDGDRNTGWRCDGAATGVVVTLQLPVGAKVAEVGLVNGYAKVDPSSQGRRYPEYRRLLLVRWGLPDGSTVEQQLVDGTDQVQKLRVPVASGNGPLTLTVLSATEPGLATGRDAVVISEVWVGQPA